MKKTLFASLAASALLLSGAAFANHDDPTNPACGQNAGEFNQAYHEAHGNPGQQQQQSGVPGSASEFAKARNEARKAATQPCPPPPPAPAS